MKFAFSTVGCPKWNFETILARAVEYGYDGVELCGFPDGSTLTASNPFLTDPAKLRQQFESTGVQICCLSSAITISQKRSVDEKRASDLRQFIDAAHSLNCPLVKVRDIETKSGQTRARAGVALGDWLLPLGDYAADRNVMIVVENALSFRASKDMWAMLDRLSHPSVACCWDAFNAALVGEMPAVSVPVLNSRIQHVHVKDATISPQAATYCELGDGNVPIERFLTRLRGIGYDGWVTVEWEKMLFPELAEPEEVFPAALATLRAWVGVDASPSIVARAR